MSSSARIDNKKKDILILGVGPTYKLQKMYSINFTATNIQFCLSLHYNGENSY